MVTYKDLITKNWPPRTVTNIAFTARQFFRLDFVISNLVALIICGMITALLQQEWLIPTSSGYNQLIMIAVGITATIQVWRSAEKSMIIPTFCIISATLFLYLTHNHFMLPFIPPYMMRVVAGIGIIGCCISLLRIR